LTGRSPLDTLLPSPKSKQSPGKANIKYFFVHPAQQKMGIGQLLWQFAKNSGAFGETLKVRSSLFAVPVYERLGFKITEPPGCFNGLHFQPMFNHHP
jgi:GNAT superfamily N-acetyltransferase